VSPSETRYGLAQQTAGQQAVVAKRRERIEQHNIQVAS
jgi:hypothetical protein